jgi:hypothetical protein
VTEKGSRVTDYGWCSRRSRIGTWVRTGILWGGGGGMRFPSVPYNGLAPLADLTTLGNERR